MTSADDVLELFDLRRPVVERGPLGPAAEALLERLRDGALTGDELVRTSGIDSAAASAALVELELARRIALEDGVYRVSA